MEIELKNLSKTYVSADGLTEVKAVDDISLKIPSNEIFGIIGRSGAGKSSLVRLVSMMERPDSGEVLYDGLRVDILGVPAGTYSISLDTTKGKITQSGIKVSEQDRSGFAHYNYDKGVGAYTDGGTIKANAKILYVTNENKNTVSVTSKDGTTVTGIGNILNSAGMESSGGKTANGGVANSNKGIIKKLAEDGTPLVVRIIGDVTAPEGVTVFDSVDNGGSVGDNGGMARMKSGKDVTIEGVGFDATVNGWGFHFMAESAAPDFGKSFEV